MHQRNRVSIKSSTWHSDSKAAKREMAFIRTPFPFQPKGPPYICGEALAKVDGGASHKLSGELREGCSLLSL